MNNPDDAYNDINEQKTEGQTVTEDNTTPTRLAEQHRKTPVIMLYTVVSLVLLVAATYAAMRLFNDWKCLFVGAGLMVGAVFAHLAGRKAKVCLIISFVLNSIGNGFSVAAYYLAKDLPLPLTQMMIAVLPAALITLLAAVTLLVAPQLRRAVVIAACILNAAVGITAAVLAITSGNSVYSFAFFALLIAFFYLPLLYVTKSSDSLLRSLSHCSFCIFIVVTLVVIVIISEGEVLDGIGDVFPVGEGSEKRGRKLRK